VLDGVFFGDEEIVGEGIGENAVYFFGHGAIEAAEAGFDVGYGNAEFYGSQRDGDGGIDVANNENQIRLVFEQDGLDALEDLSGLRGMGAGADFEIDVRGGNAHLAEENVGKGFIVVLAGMDEDGFDLRVALHLADERSNLREIGASAYNVDDFQAGDHELLGSVRGQKYSI
jgi:hypothetical protein